MANSIAGEAGIGIRRIGPIILPEIAEVRQQFGMPNIEQGPDQDRGVTQRPHTRHSRQTANTGTAKDAVEDRFGLIVGIVSRDHISCTQAFGGAAQEAVAGTPGCRFKALAGSRREIPRRPTPNFVSQADIACQTSDELGVVG